MFILSNITIFEFAMNLAITVDIEPRKIHDVSWKIRKLFDPRSLVVKASAEEACAEEACAEEACDQISDYYITSICILQFIRENIRLLVGDRELCIDTILPSELPPHILPEYYSFSNRYLYKILVVAVFQGLG